jgi:hypothetical protein
MRAGHADEEKKAFYHKVVENFAREPGIDPACHNYHCREPGY